MDYNKGQSSCELVDHLAQSLRIPGTMDLRQRASSSATLKQLSLEGGGGYFAEVFAVGGFAEGFG
jgi:ATP-dependent exoDNAse (exonuclease V) alpha subunit